MPTSLTGQTVASTYGQLLHLDGGATGSLKTLYDGDGTATAMQLSNAGYRVAGTGEVTGLQTFGAGVREKRVALASPSNIDISQGSVFTYTVSGVTSFTILAGSIPAAGTVASFLLDLTNGGSAAITWWANLRWPSGVTPVLTAAGRDVLGFYTHDAGANWTGLLLGRDVK
jgi:hypothetical protein